MLPELAGRTIGTLSHPIVLGSVAALVILVPLTTGFSRRPWWRLTCLAAGVVALCLSGTRSALIVVVVAIFVQALRGRTIISGVSGRICLTLLALFSITLVDFRELRVISSLEGSLSLINRLGSWRVLMTVFEESPADLLVGLGANANEILAREGYLATSLTSAIDNAFVSTLLSGGLSAVLVLIFISVRALANSDALASGLALVSVGMMLSFDVLFWPVPTLVLLVASFRPRQTKPEEPTAASSPDAW
ncbi:hypothetical protein GL325_10910 [Aeromicrobium sp. 636]|uniref:O-antigen ligase family protein n=1 Tax=Aeromicrobium senzhongii TaxID=2663859 RepID=A0A8I0K1F3_9ACTN|nr:MULTISPECIES: hypothetical protein [Aeromicrobium]MBC9226838.1 hypothetical protein [Aeromicrobium senzhongii]MCQ3998938.1 hypothetical protein [Aeromicrobium sp. 636]